MGGHHDGRRQHNDFAEGCQFPRRRTSFCEVDPVSTNIEKSIVENSVPTTGKNCPCVSAVRIVCSAARIEFHILAKTAHVFSSRGNVL